VNDAAADEAQFLALVTAAEAKDPLLTPVQAALLVAAEQDIARDSRSFAKIFGIAHALVLRELTALIERGEVLRTVKRDERTMRLLYETFSSDTAHPL
jgi:phage regulator Rha-like protein